MTIKIPNRPRLWFVKKYPTNKKKRTFMQRLKTWLRHYKKPCYRLNGQIAMF
ncbi:hypothetical protein JW911_04910 [Candidatus Peregrinibacteria bacterium]|nr:hypothetical protein [Candidatus Peregrinibacteria bacterium]